MPAFIAAPSQWMTMLHIKTVSKKNLHPVSVVLVQSIGEIIPWAISLKLCTVHRSTGLLGVAINQTKRFLICLLGAMDCLHKNFNAVVVFDATYI